MTDSISLAEDEPRILSFVTYPRGQVIFSILALCAIILFNSFFYLFRPYDGMGVTQEGPLGEVYAVDPGGPAAKAGVQIGDQILAIDRKPIQPLVSKPRYRPGIRLGDVVRYDLERNGQVMQVSITMGSNFDNTSLLALYLGVQLLSLGLWAVGLVLTLFTPVDDFRARLVSLGFLMAGLTAAVGGASGWNSFWGAPTIEKVLLSILGPVIISAHLTFPSISFPRIRTNIIYLSLAIGGLLAALVMIDDWVLTPGGHSFAAFPGIHLRPVILVFFMVSWLAAIALLINNRLRAPDPDVRRQTGIIIWGMALGIGPFFAFTLLPYILFGQEYLTGSVTILFLLLVPLAYTYVIFQRKLLKVDFLINRIVVWFILVLLILIVSILIFGIFVLIFKLPSGLPLYGGAVAALIALPFASLSKTVQREVDKVLYGSHYEFSTVTSSLSSQLAQALDRRRLIDLLTQDLPHQMGIQEAALLLVERDRLKLEGNQEKLTAISLDDQFCIELLEDRGPLRSFQLARTFVSPRQSAWKEFAWGQVFAPLLFENHLQGVLILGRRASGDIYSDQDLSIIATVAQQGALAAVNVFLVERLRRLTQQLVRSDETQRKHLASDLHNSVLQDFLHQAAPLQRLE